jgi:His-Xaa-Ser system protein HxsD
MTQPAPPPFTIVEGRCHIDLDIRAFRLIAVQKAAYRLADRCTVVLGALGDTNLRITLILPPATPESRAMEVARLFFQELLDQELREHLAEESQPIRALILAHAFSRTDLVRRQ